MSPQLASKMIDPSTAVKKVLHVGCGSSSRNQIPAFFEEHLGNYQEVRFDINPDVNPDIIGDIRDLKNVEDESVDGLFSSHNIEHIFTHEIPTALQHFYRVLKPGGILCILCPDIQAVAEEVAKGRLEEPLYNSSAGLITAQDIMYGHIASVARGEIYMAHKTSFTADSLGAKLFAAGFRGVEVSRMPSYNLAGLARKLTTPTEEENKIQIFERHKPRFLERVLQALLAYNQKRHKR
jgi:predicted SAM-dependent methyltransferase